MKTKSWKVQRSKGYRLIIILFTMFLGGLYLGSYQVSEKAQLEGREILEEGIKRAVVQCYAIEGVYPPDIDYIKKHYGVGVDEKRYIVHYEIFASNIMPEIKVIRKSWED